MEELEKSLNIIFNPNKAPALWNATDKLERIISQLPEKRTGEVIERGTTGLYSREINLSKGTLLTSKIHRQHHQFIISKGSILVTNVLTDETELMVAPYHGITYPGTRRVLYVFEDTVWTTMHPTNRIDSTFSALNSQEQERIFGDIMGDLIQPYDNPLITEYDDGFFI